MNTSKPSTPSHTPRRPNTTTSTTTHQHQSTAALPKHLQQPPIPQPPPWSAKVIRPIDHHVSAYKKSAMEAFEQELQEKQHNNGSNNNNVRKQMKIGEKEIRDRDSWQTLSTMTHMKEETALAAIRRIFVAANLRRKTHLEAVARRDAKASSLESAGDRVLLSLGIDPKAVTPGSEKPLPIVDPLIRCLQGSTFLGDLIGIQQEQQQQQQQQQNGISGKKQDGEEFPTVVPEEFWVFEDTPLIGSIGLEEDIIASEERKNQNVPENQRSSHTASLSARVFPSRGSRCAESRVEVYYLANALDTMIQRYLQRGVFPRYPRAEQLQEREETLFDIIMCGMRELVRHNAARTIERGRVLERLRLAIEMLWDSRKITLDKAQAEIRELCDVNDPTKFVDLERLVEQQAMEIEQLKLSVSELKEQNEVLKGMDHLLKLARDKEKAVSEYLTRQAARNVTLSRLQQQIEMDMSEFEKALNEAMEGGGDDSSGSGGGDPSASMANLLRGVRNMKETLQNGFNDSTTAQHENTTKRNRDAFAPVLEITAEEARLHRKKSFSKLGKNFGSPANHHRSVSGSRRRLTKTGSAMNFGVVDGLDGSRELTNDDSGTLRGGGRVSPYNDSESSFSRYNNATNEANSSVMRANPEDLRDFSVQCNMDRSHDMEIMESTRSLLETTGTMLHVADKLTVTFFGNEISKDRDPIGHDGMNMLKELTRKTLMMEATLREAVSNAGNPKIGINQSVDEDDRGTSTVMGAHYSPTAIVPADASTLASQFGQLYPIDSSQKSSFNKEMLSNILNTCYEGSREVHVRLNALSRHPGVANAVDPLVPPTSPDQPCTLCGRTVLRRAEEGEDELQRAINEIEQLTASLERSHLEKEMFKEEIVRLETRLRRKGLATMVDGGNDVDPALERGRELTPAQARQKAEWSARCVLKAVKAFRNLIFVDGDFNQLRRKPRQRRRTLVIGGSGAIKLHKAASMFNRAGSMRRTLSSSRSKSPPQNGDSGSPFGSMKRLKSGGAPAADQSLRNETSTSSPFRETNAFDDQNNNNNIELIVSSAHGGSTGSLKLGMRNSPKNNTGGGFDGKSSPSPRNGSAERFKSLVRKTVSNNNLKGGSKSSSPAAKSAGNNNNNTTNSSSKSPAASHHQKPPTSPHSKSPINNNNDPKKKSNPNQQQQPLKPLGWVVKAFQGALTSFAKQDTNAYRRESQLLESQQRKLSQASSNPPGDSPGLLLTSGPLTSSPSQSGNVTKSPSFAEIKSRRRSLSGTLKMMMDAENSNDNEQQNSREGTTVPIALGDLHAFTSNDLDFSETCQTMDDALADYFRQQLGTKPLVDEAITAFHQSWPFYRKLDPRITLIEKMFGDKHIKKHELQQNSPKEASLNHRPATTKILRSTKGLMLYVVSSLSKTLDETAEAFGEKQGDEDSRRPATVPLLQALAAFHAICGSSSFFTVGVEQLIMYSSTGYFNNNSRASLTSGSSSSPLSHFAQQQQQQSPTTGSNAVFDVDFGNGNNNTTTANNEVVMPNSPKFFLTQTASTSPLNNKNTSNNGAAIFSGPTNSSRAAAFLATEEARTLLPHDINSRRIMRCRVLLLALLLEKSVAERRLNSFGASGVFEPSSESTSTKKLQKSDSIFLVPGFLPSTGQRTNSPLRNNSNNNNNNLNTQLKEFKDALGEFADCMGKSHDPNAVGESLSFGENKSFSESMGNLLRM